MDLNLVIYSLQLGKQQDQTLKSKADINKMNPYRPWIEYLANWELIERSAEDIKAIIQSHGIPEHAIHHKTDPTGMALVFTLAKA